MIRSKGAEDRIDRPVTRCGVALRFLVFVLQFNRRCGNAPGPGGSVQTDHLPSIARVADAVFDQGGDVRVVDILLLVRQGNEVREDLLEIVVVQL